MNESAPIVVNLPLTKTEAKLLSRRLGREVDSVLKTLEHQGMSLRQSPSDASNIRRFRKMKRTIDEQLEALDGKE